MTNTPTNSGYPFIPAWLDDAGLTPQEMRLVVRVARRGTCWESVTNIAQGCRLDRKTVKTVVRNLVHRGLLRRVDRVGLSSVLSLGDRHCWETQAQTAPQGAKRPRVFNTPPPGPNDTPRRYSHKVTPLKVLPSIVETIYQAYPRRVGKLAASRAITAALKKGIKGEDLLAVTQRFAKAWEGETDLFYCPHPSTWFSEERYADAPESWRRAPKPGGKARPESNQIEEQLHAKLL
jgi:hypothetical protein